MKHIAIGLIVSLSLAMSACATSGGLGMRAGSTSVDKLDQKLDQGKIIAVNRWAEIKGARVLWINLPEKTRLEDAGVKPAAD